MADGSTALPSSEGRQDVLLGVTSSARGRRWAPRETSPADIEMMVARGHDPVLAAVLSARGVSPLDAEGFLAPTLKTHLPDPFVMTGMKTAAAAIAEAVMAGETIGLFGDYDVDGTTSSALLHRYFASLGITAHVHLPDRQAEGYGPNVPALLSLQERGADLLLTVDCGATAGEVLAEARDRGLKVIVVDHHLMEEIPPALAVVNPQRPDDVSGLSMLSAGGVAFMLMVAVSRALREAGFFEGRKEPNLLQWLDLVALSLVCDVMPLKGLSRVLVRQGLAVLDRFDEGVTRGTLGIRALAAEAGCTGAAQASHFGFQIGPRINAAGRIGHAQVAFDLLTTDDPGKAATLAARLQELNGARQGVEQAVLDAALEAGEAAGGRDLAAPLVVAGEGWHPGVIGIVAGRLKERFDRPAIVIAWEGEGGKGSGRSLPGVDLGEAIGEAVAAGVISGGGGHPMAAGLSLRKDQLAPFQLFLEEKIGADIKAARADQVFRLDRVIGTGAVTRGLCESLSGAGPFGNGNPEPRFALAGVAVQHLRVLKEKHMAFSAVDSMGGQARCIAFGVVGEPVGDLLSAANMSGQTIHLAGRVKPDDWRGGEAGQFQVEDAALADG